MGTDGSAKALAQVTRSDGGYPVNVRPDGLAVGYVAGTREELEATLAELLRNVRIAAHIKTLAAGPSQKG